MNGYVVSIPISPKIEHLGHLVIPFILDVLKKNLNYESILFLNLLGIKKLNVNLDEYKNKLQQFRLCPDQILTDIDSKFLSYVEERIERMIKHEKIFISSNRIWLCENGCTEFLEEAEALSIKRSMVTKDGKCIKCGSKLNLISKSVLLYEIPNLDYTKLNIFPNFMNKEMLDLWKRFEGRKILISRTNRGVLFKNISHRIDVDFVWSFMLAYIQQFSSAYVSTPSIVMVSSIKNILASLLLLLQSEKENTPLILFPPYLKAFGSNDIKNIEILEKYNPLVVRILLGSIMNWERKETKLNDGLIKVIKNLKLETISLSGYQQEYDDVKTFLIEKFNAKFIKKLIIQKENRSLSFLL